MIYIDPPFATGADFSFTTEIGEKGLEISKEQSLLEEKAYRDTWGRGIDSYASMIHERLCLMHDLLAPSGLIYVHCDYRVNYLLRSMLDEIFGRENLRNEIVWCYRGGGTPLNDFAEKHDVILRYSRGPNYYFDVDPVRIPYSDASTERLQNKLANVFRGDKVYRNYEPHELGKHPEDWWTIQPIMPSEKQERSVCYYPTTETGGTLAEDCCESSSPGEWSRTRRVLWVAVRRSLPQRGFEFCEMNRQQEISRVCETQAKVDWVRSGAICSTHRKEEATRNRRLQAVRNVKPR